MHTEPDASERRRGRWPGTSARLEIAALAAWGACGLVLYAIWPDPDPSQGCGPNTRLVIYRARASGPERLQDGTEGHQGDVLQLAYRVEASCYGAILSLDGRGKLTRHLPPLGEQAMKLEPDAIVPLDHAFQLDDAPSFERFLLVTSPKPFPLPPVERALIEGDALPSSLRSDWFEVLKEDR